MEVEAAVCDVHGDAVLHQFEAASVEGSLDSGATDGDTGFFGAEARLDEHAGRVIEDVLEGCGFATFIGFCIDDIDASGDGSEFRAEGFDGGHGEGEAFAIDDGFLHRFGAVRKHGRHGGKEESDELCADFHFEICESFLVEDGLSVL